MQHNHAIDISSPLPYFVTKKQVAGATHTQGEGITEKGEFTAADPSLCAVANVAISLRYNVPTTRQALF